MLASVRSRIIVMASSLVALSACGGGSSNPVAPTPTATPTSSASTVSIRVVNGSPDAGPVDVYVYASSGLQPASPIVSDLVDPGISQYYSYPVGSYTIAIDAHGTSTPLETETVAGTTAGAQITVVLGGQLGASTLQLVNFIEPAEVAGQSALIVHHASPAINAAIDPVAVGVYQATATPAAASTTQLFTFALTASSSGPATTGQVTGGEYFLSPIPATVPSPLGFAAGAPGTTGTLGTIAASATLSGLATNLNASGYGLSALAKELAADTANTLPAGAHLSVFAVDSTANAPGILIGTLDP